jgi:CrcB protein
MPSSYRVLMMVALGSAVGGVLRYLVGNVLGDAVHVPWRTFVVNVTGSFVLGAFLYWSERQGTDHAGLRAFVAIGLCGGYTTFSTFSYETVVLLETGAYARAVAYALGSVVTSVGAVFAGFGVAKLVA